YLENSDDTRNTPAAPLVASLMSKGAEVRIHDPYVKEWEFSPQKIKSDIEKTLENSDCIALVTKHAEYYGLDLDHVKSLMRTPGIVDGRNVFDQETVEAAGYEYRCIGKQGAKRS
ncbi:MAG: UDP binding domain-containing protein, partial [Promethearchaeia archaeon]